MNSEQEQLAQLVGNQNAPEPSDYTDLLAQGLAQRIGEASREKVDEVKKEIEASGDHVDLTSKSSVRRQGSKLNVSTEKILLSLYNVRDGLVGLFETHGIQPAMANPIVAQIKNVDTCIKIAGGDIEEFAPLNHVSGLNAPSLVKNAQKVIETTLQCYRLGRIDSAKLAKDGKEILISFSGQQGKTLYKADGTVASDSWSGNEAIDYIYAPKEGKMSIKAYENGRWIDKSETGKYEVYWELQEWDEGTKIAKNTEAVSEKEQKEQKEITAEVQNNDNENGEEEISTPISK
jgi:hypothetical protein